MVVLGDADNILRAVLIICRREASGAGQEENQFNLYSGSLSRCAGDQFMLYLDRKHQSHVHDSAHLSSQMQMRFANAQTQSDEEWAIV